MTMDQQAQLSELIGEIYDAALDASQWSDVVGKADVSSAARRRQSIPRAQPP
jgi:hypothetical protein